MSIIRTHLALVAAALLTPALVLAVPTASIPASARATVVAVGPNDSLLVELHDGFSVVRSSDGQTLAVLDAGEVLSASLPAPGPTLTLHEDGSATLVDSQGVEARRFDAGEPIDVDTSSMEDTAESHAASLRVRSLRDGSYRQVPISGIGPANPIVPLDAVTFQCPGGGGGCKFWTRCCPSPPTRSSPWAEKNLGGGDSMRVDCGSKLVECTQTDPNPGP